MKRRSHASRPSLLSSQPVLLPSYEGEDDDDARLLSPKSVITPRNTSPPTRGTSFDVAGAIRTFKLFETAPEALIDLLMSRMRSRVVEKGDEICREGEDAKAMYWIIRGAVAVVSRDTESKYAELASGHFFGEIGVLFSMPRTASVVAMQKSLLMALTLDDLHQVLPRFPAVERAIREEAQERLELLMKHKNPPSISLLSASMRDRILAVPIFRDLPQDILHYLGLKMKPARFPPFTPILVQNMPGREIYFLVSGSVEIIDAPSSQIRARLGPGQFFGELAWLSLSPLRTASVRSITEVDSLVLEDSVLQEISRVFPEMRRSIEKVAQERLANGQFLMSGETSPASQKGPGTPSTDVDQDPFNKSSVKRKLSIPTRASPRNSTQSASAASQSAASPVRKKSRKYSSSSENQKSSTLFAGCIPRTIVSLILSFMPITAAVKFRLVHSSWNTLILTMPLNVLSLIHMARFVDDQVLTQVSVFAGQRPRIIDISYCSHLTDAAFTAMATYCGASVISFSLVSCWNISPTAMVDLVIKAPNLKRLNLANCRKMNDQALFRIINTAYKLEELDLGYCKHISDRSMHCIAVHASSRLRVLKLSRCTSVTDAGFGYWSYAPTGFPHLNTLVLRDCTFLSDNSIVALTNSCSVLQYLDLSFCCALSDTSVEVLALGLPSLQHLLLAFCGSAVSDSSLRSVSRHLQNLKELNVRGCVRVTDLGVKAILTGVQTLEILDITQCRNVRGQPARAGVDVRTGG